MGLAGEGGGDVKIGFLCTAQERGKGASFGGLNLGTLVLTGTSHR